MISIDVSLSDTVSEYVAQSLRGQPPLQQSTLVDSEPGYRLMRRLLPLSLVLGMPEERQFPIPP